MTEDLFIPIHTYKDPSSEFKYRIIIKDAPKKTTVWTVIGVDEHGWLGVPRRKHQEQA